MGDWWIHLGFSVHLRGNVGDQGRIRRVWPIDRSPKVHVSASRAPPLRTHLPHVRPCIILLMGVFAFLPPVLRLLNMCFVSELCKPVTRNVTVILILFMS